MSTVSSSAAAGPPEWVPAPLYRMSLEKYEAVAACGVLGPKDRVHFIKGLPTHSRSPAPSHAAS
jgi:hypothetical protein